jgi:hypothetical protein
VRVARGQRTTPFRFVPFHAKFAGTCANCGRRFEEGTVIHRLLGKGFAHQVCPVQGDVPLAD